MAQRIHRHIPEDSNPLQEKFINYIMLDGKKSIARTIFKDVMDEIKKKGHKNPETIFEKAIETVEPSMEVRPKRIGGAVYQIPMEVKPKRRIMLSFRWILSAARKEKGSPVAVRIARQLLDASEGIGAAVKKKEDTHKMAAANKAFAHYARY
ncbi:30S ribosomal protein S7 [Candidatus Peregrinibacteria bacterium]|jgi:small subunit ribosomal protein S7|nr:30S ribosomal protein S7 [Candidatus Peregrinibacteria bacterium]MBT7483947.1 30S ribosomal protein S7 [Candidatus Peregrinibacteria bacterium]MBT7703680.1 30S ribosomal protein S7 [Candidatus Peregrinibacteria bacterium]